MMNLRQLQTVWWASVYPAGHAALCEYVKMVGRDWEGALRRNFQRRPHLLDANIVRVCTELGTRMFDPSPSFRIGDGATLVSKFGRAPATVVAASSRSVTITLDECYPQASGERALYVPTNGIEHTFTLRADGGWRPKGGTSHMLLIYGRSYYK